jgi:hypothetical protein
LVMHSRLNNRPMRGAAIDIADDTSSSSFLRRRPFWWFLIGLAGAARSVWGSAQARTVHFWVISFSSSA